MRDVDLRAPLWSQDGRVRWPRLRCLPRLRVRPGVSLTEPEAPQREAYSPKCVEGWVSRKFGCRGLRSSVKPPGLLLWAQSPVGSTGKGDRAMAWRLEGTYVENCNCDVVCPCGAS